MTPTAIAAVVRSSLRTILQGAGTLEARMDAVVEALKDLPCSDRQRIVKQLKPKVERALRQHSATLRVAVPLPAEVKTKIENFSKQRGMLFLQEEEKEKLLAGFSLQLGDDRMNFTLQSRLHAFIEK